MANYMKNVDVIDKNNLKDVWVHESVIFSGDAKVVNKKQEDEYISPLLGAAVLGLNNTAAPISSTANYDDLWSDIDVQEMYLNTKPTCYLILGKPGLGAYNLGEAFSKKYNCIHLCPKNILLDEILQGSLTGKCLDFNMKHTNICSHKTIMKILKAKIESPAVQHRGYVISCIPLVTAYKQPVHLIKSNHSESALGCVEELLYNIVYNLNKKSPKVPESSTSSNASFSDRILEEEKEEHMMEEEHLQEEVEQEEQEVELPKFLLNTCSSICFNIETYFQTKEIIYLQQLEGLFNLSLKPNIVIHITCPDIDVVTIKRHKYVNYKNNQYIIKPFINKIATDLRWPNQYNITDYDNPHENHLFNPKYHCIPPINFAKKSVQQLCNYKNCILSFIEKTLMNYDPKQVIKLDGRTSIHQMIHQIKEKLVLMHIHPIIIPEPLYTGEPSDDLEEFWKVVEKTHVIQSGNLKFGLCASPWANRCPVELKKRQSVIGKQKFAVMFFKHVYLMYSHNNFLSFCMNPRPFLTLKYLEPTCRIVVIGTKSSGKTMTAECLSWLFDTPVTNFEILLDTIKDKKYQVLVKNIFSEIIATIEDKRFIEWQQKELDRVTSLNEWNNSMLAKVREYLPLLKQRFVYTMESQSKPKQEIGGIAKDEVNVFEDKTPGVDSDFAENYELLCETLSGLPILDSIEACEAAIMDESLLKYAPLELTTIIEKPALPVLGDEDVTQTISDYIAANELQNNFEPTVEEVMDEIINFISTVDLNKRQQVKSNEAYGKYIIDGFPSDPEYWHFFSIAKLMPDYTIALMENREIEPELLLHYLSITNSIKNHQEIFASLKDPLILSKLQTKQFSDTKVLNMKMIVNDLVNNVLQSLVSHEFNTELTEPSTELITSFTESIESFRENWDVIKIKLEEKSKCYIEIELENKTDIVVLEEVLLRLRQAYFLKSAPIDDEEAVLEEEDDFSKDPNFPQNLCETTIYCPYTYFNYGVLWQGKKEFALKFDNKIHYFSKEECLESFQRDITKYQAYNIPFKSIPKLKICITGCLGSGKTVLSKYIARELGLIHVDFEDLINCIRPRHFKKVGRKYENPFIDTPLEEEHVQEFQIDEENPNILADILSSETEFKRMVYNYYERGQPIKSIIMHKTIKRLWFDDPFIKMGFVLDGYPRLPQDIEDMGICNCIPDLIINLDSNPETILGRLGTIMFKQWKLQLKEAKHVHKMKIQKEKNEWMQLITKKVVVKIIIEEILDNLREDEILPEDETLSDHSFIFDAHPLGATHVDPKLFSAYNELIAEYSEPTDTYEWENPEAVRERIDSRLEAIYELEYENSQALKEVVEDYKIKMITIDGEKPFYKVCRMTLSKLSPLRNRSQSFFEQTSVITNDIAEILLSKGYCFLSKFGRLCPVYIHENQQMIINSYKISKHKGQLLPVVHRAYVYFISGETSVNKFKSDPLKYITSNAIQAFYSYPLRIGVIGAPKSGKSTLSVNLARRNNLICISKGKALRYVLENLHWTELAFNMQKNLRNGEIINSDLMMEAVHVVAIDHRTDTYGFVLDGFPSSPYEAMVLTKVGLYPNIIFDISSDKRIILDNSQNEIYFDIIKYKPSYSYSFIASRFTEWDKQCYKIRQWVKNEYQNTYVLRGNQSKWQCLQSANNKIKELMAQIHYYLANVQSNIVPASVMAISNQTFELKQSAFKKLCPACTRTNVFRHIGSQSDKTGLVQFQNKLYWICPQHLDRVLKYPEYYLSKEISIPELPAIVKIINSNNVYENGICIVTYAEKLPAQILERGTNKYAATYKLNTYLFCSEACLQKFLDKPHLYADITVFRESSGFARLSLKKLPNLGYLEQTLANILTEACCAVNIARPKYPGLNLQISALIYIGLYLKSHNTLLPKDISVLYKKAWQQFEQRSKLILELGLRMRSMTNPFLIYPEKSIPKKIEFKWNRST